MNFNSTKKYYLILSLSFISIAFAAKNEGEQCRFTQECNQGLTCIQRPMVVQGSTGNIDANLGRCSSRDRGEQVGHRPISREEMQRLQNLLTQAPVSSSQVQGQPKLLTRMPSSTTSTGPSYLLTPAPVSTSNAGQSQLLTQTPVATDAFGPIQYTTTVPVNPRAER